MHWKWHYKRYKKIGDLAFAEIFAEWRDGAGELSAAPLVASMFQSRGAGANSEEFKDQQCESSHSLPAVHQGENQPLPAMVPFESRSLPAVPTAALTKL
jgi:hypothetical protein